MGIDGEHLSLKQVNGKERQTELGVNVDVLRWLLNVDLSDPQIAVTDQILLLFGILANQRGIERIAPSQTGILRGDPQNHTRFRREVTSYVIRQRRR